MTKTILFSGHDLRFIQPFIDCCSASPNYQVLLETHNGHRITDESLCRELLQQADIVFCEWALGNAAWYSTNKRQGQKLIVRLHAQELRGLPFLDEICWEAVDRLIVICPLNRERVLERYPFLANKTELIFNPIDCSTLFQEKLPGAEFNLGVIGICPMMKRVDLAFEIFQKLKGIDSRYMLLVKGKAPQEYDWLWRRPEERAFYERFYAKLDQSGLRDSVLFEGYGSDVAEWLSKVGFILSASDYEGSHQAVAEGMASGAIPVIRNWAGATQMYPEKYVWGSVEEAVAQICKWRQADHYIGEAEFAARYAREHFDQQKICSQLQDLLETSAGNKPMEMGSPSVLVLAYLPPTYGGGYRIRIEQEIKALNKLGCATHLVCLMPETCNPAELEAYRRDLQSLGAKVHLVRIPHFFDLQLHGEMVAGPLEELRQIIVEHRIGIVHAEAIYCMRIALLLKERSAELKLVFDCHGTAPEEARMNNAHPKRVAALAELERHCIAGADMNVFVSEAMRQFYLKEYGFAELPAVIVPCCVAEERFPKKDAACALAELPSQRPILVYLGTMAAWQCAQEMLGLFARLRELAPELFLLLLVPPSDHPLAREFLEKNHIPPESVLLTGVKHHEVAPILQQCHAGFLLRKLDPVNRVSSPTKFGEYLAAGLPVIMTEGIGDFSALAESEGVGITLSHQALENPSPQELQQIVDFVRQCAHGGRSEQCRNVARREIHWDQAAGKLLEAYKRLGSAASILHAAVCIKATPQLASMLNHEVESFPPLPA